MQFSTIPGAHRKESAIPGNDLYFLNAENPLISRYGILYENGSYRRMPESAAKAVSEKLEHLHTDTSGGRICFRTDSRYLSISVLPGILGNQMPGESEFDLFQFVNGNQIFVGTISPSAGKAPVLEMPSREMREFVLYFPLFQKLCSLELGLEGDSSLEASLEKYLPGERIVYYGSSTTQGMGASHPGCTYPAMVSRRFHCDFLNLGFSGGTLAEESMIDYLSQVPMSVFVQDYDRDAPTPEHLEATHFRLYRAVRKTHPSIPIILMSRPVSFLSADESARLQIIWKSYDKAVIAGDQNVYLLTNKELTRYLKQDRSPDGQYAAIAEALGNLLEQIGCLDTDFRRD